MVFFRCTSFGELGSIWAAALLNGRPYTPPRTYLGLSLSRRYAYHGKLTTVSFWLLVMEVLLTI